MSPPNSLNGTCNAHVNASYTLIKGFELYKSNASNLYKLVQVLIKSFFLLMATIMSSDDHLLLNDYRISNSEQNKLMMIMNLFILKSIKNIQIKANLC